VANGLLYAPDTAPDPATPNPTDGGHVFDALTGVVVGSYRSSCTPAIGPEIGYFRQDGVLRAIQLSTNTVLWNFAGDGQLDTAPILVNDVVFIGSRSGLLYALDGASGVTRGSWQLGEPIAYAEYLSSGSVCGLAAGDGLLVVPTDSAVTAFLLSAKP
jgi:outer membrane protein assembly factor BamB